MKGMVRIVRHIVTMANELMSANLHNYVALCFLVASLLAAFVALVVIVVGWWLGKPALPKEALQLLDSLLLFLGASAGINATAHVTKALGKVESGTKPGAGGNGGGTPAPVGE